MIRALKQTAWKAALLAAIMSLLGLTAALAASGDLDATFSGNGLQNTDFANGWYDEIHALALQSDGKIVAAGMRYDPANSYSNATNFAVARYNANGNLDGTFSGDGKQLTDFGGFDWAEDVAIQPSDGKIVVSGYSCTTICRAAVARYNPNGSPDTTFNGTGRKLLSIGSHGSGNLGGLAIQSDGKIVVAGYTLDADGYEDFAVWRLNPNGVLDSTFSGDGRASFPFAPNRVDRAYDLQLQGSKILLAGESCDLHYVNCNFALIRLTSGGALDKTFSGDGKQATDFGADEHIYGLAVGPDSKIVAVGEQVINSSTYTFALARYNPNGSLDTTFNASGKKIVNFGASSAAASVLVQPNGKIVVAGRVALGAGFDFALARLNPGGGLDATFSGDGKTSIDFNEHTDSAYAVLRQGDGKYVLGGQMTSGTQYDFGLARVLP